MSSAVRETSGGVEVDVWVQPRASRNELCGLREDALKIRLAAPPVEGEANAALVRFLADLTGAPRSSVELVRGHSGRRKTVRIRGVSAEQARQALGLG
ncbi:MAG: YggU family protein [Deltaproteobacteria bacterium]|nr:YggU family protein [Deltaproteobacteria bacterium]